MKKPKDTGWILIHAKSRYGKPPLDFESPQDELAQMMQGKPKIRWPWTKKCNDPESGCPFSLLLAYNGKVFGDAKASITEPNADEKAEDPKYKCVFVLTNLRLLESGKEISLEELNLQGRANQKVDGDTVAKYEKLTKENTALNMDDVEAEHQAEVAKSLNDDDTVRQQRLAAAPKMPQIIQVVSNAFRRNPDVIAVVRIRANGICEECHSPAPFHRASDDSPYLEVHHRIMLSAGGEDTVANALALCPNCHRKLHYGKSDTPSEVVSSRDSAVRLP